jgi:glycosyltransferase involved in cell wall biosynthesis
MFANAAVIQRIYNWIDLDTFYPRNSASIKIKYGIKNCETVILGVAQGWSNAKGLDRFIDLAKQNSTYRIVLIGQIDSGIVLPHNIICVGLVSDPKELAEYYSMADVFLNCSIQETFGKVSAEALACGTPIITNKATANPEVADGCGYIVDTNDIEKISDAIAKIKKDGGKSHYKSICIKKAKQSFEMRTNLHEYVSLFERVI